MTQVLGPSLGGVLISAFGAPVALWVSTAWYGVSLTMLLPLRGYGVVIQSHTESTVKMITSGFRTIMRDRLATTVLLITLAANIFLWPVYQSFMPVFARDNLGIDAAGLGWLLACSGSGGLIGSLVIAGLGDFRFKGGLFVVGTATWGALWSLFALSHDATTSFVLMGAIGLMSAAFGVLQTTLLMLTTEPAVHGRALGLQELAIGAMPVSSLGLGGFAEAFGVGITTFISAVLLVVCVIILAVRTPRLLSYSGIRTRPPRNAVVPRDRRGISADGYAGRWLNGTLPDDEVGPNGTVVDDASSSW